MTALVINIQKSCHLGSSERKAGLTKYGFFIASYEGDRVAPEKPFLPPFPPIFFLIGVIFGEDR